MTPRASSVEEWPMTLASWFSSLRHSRRRSGPTGTRRNRPHASRRSASFEALEVRSLLSSVGFSTASETVRRERRHVQHPGHALWHRHSKSHHLRLRVRRSHRRGLQRRQPLRRQLRHPHRRRHSERGDARGCSQRLRLRVQHSRRPGVRLVRRPLRRQPRQQHGEQGDAGGGGQHLRHRVRRSLQPNRSTPPATSTSPTSTTTR